MSKRLSIAALVLVAIVPGVLRAQDEEAPPAPALAIAGLAGQRIPVLPVTYLVAESGLDSLLPTDRTSRLRWADTVVSEALLYYGPELTWVLSPELKRAARRAPGMVVDPERMGQAVMRSRQLDKVPDPLRGYLRGLTAMTDARLVMIPAAIRFREPAADGTIMVEIAMVIADSRNGSVVWRSNPRGEGATPTAALEAAIAHILPDIN